MKPSLSRLHRSKFAAVTAVALLSGLGAGAYSVSYDVDTGFLGPLPLDPTPFPVALNLPQFNASLPELPPEHQGIAFIVGVELRFVSYIRLEGLGLENTSPVPSDITFSQVLNSTFAYPTPVSNPTTSTEALNPDIAFMESFPAFDGVIDYGGTSGATHTEEDSTFKLDSVLASAPGAYHGAGNFTFSYDATLGNATITADTGKTFDSLLPDGFARGFVEVTYFYDIPETSTVISGAGLLLLLGAAGWRARRRA